MATKIAHASIDEHGKATGGAAGDQTGKEVCVRSWYDKKWDFVLRPISAEKAARIAREAEAGALNAWIGYDQWQRLTLIKQARLVEFDFSKIAVACECDCSSFANACAIAAGIAVDESLRTGTMGKGYLATGEFVKLTDKKYLTSGDYLLPGDIPVAENDHTVIVISEGAKAAGETRGEAKTYALGERELRTGDVGADVTELQTALKAMGYALGTFGTNKNGIDGDYGKFTAAAVAGFQQDFGLPETGVFDLLTYQAYLLRNTAPAPEDARYTIMINNADEVTKQFLARVFPRAIITAE